MLFKSNSPELPHDTHKNMTIAFQVIKCLDVTEKGDHFLISSKKCGEDV